jgi:hypothetical protein
MASRPVGEALGQLFEPRRGLPRLEGAYGVGRADDAVKGGGSQPGGEPRRPALDDHRPRGLPQLLREEGRPVRHALEAAPGLAPLLGAEPRPGRRGLFQTPPVSLDPGADRLGPVEPGQSLGRHGPVVREASAVFEAETPQVEERGLEGIVGPRRERDHGRRHQAPHRSREECPAGPPLPGRRDPGRGNLRADAITCRLSGSGPGRGSEAP